MPRSRSANISGNLISQTLNVATLNVSSSFSSVSAINTATANITTIVTGNTLTLSTGTGSNSNVVISANGTEYLRISNTGNVGIGTANPTIFGGGLQVSRASQAGVRISATGGSGPTGIEIGADSSNTGYIQTVTANAKLQFYTGAADKIVMTLLPNGNVGIGNVSAIYRTHIAESGITAAAISTGWPHYNAEAAAQSKYVLYLDAGGNGSVATAGQGASATLMLGNYYDSRGIITMIGAGGASPSDQGTAYGKDLMVKAGNSDNGNGLKGGRLFLAGGSGYNGGAFGTLYGDVIMQPQGGNVGIGTTNPGAIFHSYISSGYAGRFETGTDAQIALISPNSWAGILFNDESGSDHIWFWGGTGTFTIGGGGSNQIAGKKLHVDGGTSIGSSMDNTAMPTSGLLVEGVVRAGPNWGAGDLQLSGDLSGYAVNTYPTLKTSGGSIHFDAQGTYTGYISYNSGFGDVSDARLKEDVRDIVNPFDVILNLRGVKFKWNDNRDGGQDHSGFIAQEVQEHLPEAVTTSDPGILGIHTPPIVAYLVEAVKEQQAQIATLKSRIEALETT